MIAKLCIFLLQNTYDSLPSLKVPDLKEILKQQSLKQSGKKADLIERIKENLSYNEVSEHMNQYFLKITDLGDETLKHYYYIVPAHKNDSKDGIYNVATAIKFVNYHKGNYNPPNGDISWALFQKAYMKEAEKYNYGLMRNIIMNKADQLKNEEQFKNSLFHYLRVYVFDTSGLSNGKRLLHPNYQNYNVLISDSIESIMYVLDFSENDLKELFDNVWNQSEKELIFHYLTKNECFEGLLRSFEDNEEEFLKQHTFVSYKKLNKKSFEEKYNVDYPIDYSEYLD